jgi:ribosomal protein S27E
MKARAGTMMNSNMELLDVECPKCGGHGEVFNARSPRHPLECVHCDAMGFIPKAQAVRDEVLAAVLAEVAQTGSALPKLDQSYDSWIISAAYCVAAAIRIKAGAA